MIVISEKREVPPSLTVALGVTARSALITQASAGAERRALGAGQSVVVSACSSAGLLMGAAHL